MNRASKRTATKRVLSTVAMATGILLSGSTAQGEPKAAEPGIRHAEIAVASGPTTNKQTSWSENTGEVLYNGIRLPAVWPPQRLEPSSAEAMPVPYLEHRPTVIPIDIGRQLFVDDFLIEETSLKRTFHQAKKYAGNPGGSRGQ